MISSNPFTREVEELFPAYAKAFERTLRSGWYILGKEVEAFENEFARYLGASFGIGCASGLDALMLALRALGIGPGDEVITTPLSAAATALAITHLGAKPVFADVDPATLCLDPAKAQAQITSRTKAIIPVHLYGYPAPNDKFETLCSSHGLHLIEDCAQSVGAKGHSGKMTGNTGIIGCFSFYPTKNLGAFGDAGFMCTRDAVLAEKLRMLRNYGQKKRYEHILSGYNSRLDEVHAAILREKLKHLEKWTERRIEIGRFYDSELSHSWKLPKPPSGGRSVYHLYPVQAESQDHRDQMIAKFKNSEIEGLVHYPTLIPEQECYAGQYPSASEAWPVAFAASRRLISLPISPYLNDSEIGKVVETLR